MDEFCVGGPLSNLRTKAILKKYYPDFNVELAADPIPGTYHASFQIAGKEVTIGENEEYSFLVKTRTNYSKTVHLLFGITPLGTAGAAYYLYRYYRDIFKLYGQSPYFIVLKSDLSLGYKTVQLVTEIKDMEQPVLRPH